MKRIISIFLLLAMLSGCTDTDTSLQRALTLREKLCKSDGITFTAHITADYGDNIYLFSVSCTAENDGDLTFSILSPDTIKGITGSLSSSGGNLTFDDTVLAFPMLAEGEVSPVSAPWLLVKTLLGGYISSCGLDDGMLRITMDDSYEDEALQLDIWLNDADMPAQAEVLWQGRRILSMTVDNFMIL